MLITIIPTIIATLAIMIVASKLQFAYWRIAELKKELKKPVIQKRAEAFEEHRLYKIKFGR